MSCRPPPVPVASPARTVQGTVIDGTYMQPWDKDSKKLRAETDLKTTLSVRDEQQKTPRSPEAGSLKDQSSAEEEEENPYATIGSVEPPQSSQSEGNDSVRPQKSKQPSKSHPHRGNFFDSDESESDLNENESRHHGDNNSKKGDSDGEGNFICVKFSHTVAWKMAWLCFSLLLYSMWFDFTSGLKLISLSLCVSLL